MPVEYAGCGGDGKQLLFDCLYCRKGLEHGETGSDMFILKPAKSLKEGKKKFLKLGVQMSNSDKKVYHYTWCAKTKEIQPYVLSHSLHHGEEIHFFWKKNPRWPEYALSVSYDVLR